MTWPRHKLINYQILENVDILMRKKRAHIGSRHYWIKFCIILFDYLQILLYPYRGGDRLSVIGGHFVWQMSFHRLFISLYDHMSRDHSANRTLILLKWTLARFYIFATWILQNLWNFSSGKACALFFPPSFFSSAPPSPFHPSWGQVIIQMKMRILLRILRILLRWWSSWVEFQWRNGSLTIQSLNCRWCRASHWSSKVCKHCVRNSKISLMPLRTLIYFT